MSLNGYNIEDAKILHLGGKPLNAPEGKVFSHQHDDQSVVWIYRFNLFSTLQAIKTTWKCYTVRVRHLPLSKNPDTYLQLLTESWMLLSCEMTSVSLALRSLFLKHLCMLMEHYTELVFFGFFFLLSLQIWTCLTGAVKMFLLWHYMTVFTCGMPHKERSLFSWRWHAMRTTSVHSPGPKKHATWLLALVTVKFRSVWWLSRYIKEKCLVCATYSVINLLHCF